MGRVVVGVDGQAEAGPALARAAEEARSLEAPLEVVTVWTYPPLSTEEQLLSLPGLLEDDARSLAEAQVDDVLGPEGERDLPVVVRVERGPPARCLLAAAVGADLLVVGRRDQDRLRHLLLGSVADQCVRHAPCPIMVVPHPEDRPDDPQGGPIVVGVDGSPSSLLALRWALAEGERTGNTVRAVHCWRVPTSVAEVPVPRPDPTAEEASATARLESLLADVSVPSAVALKPVVRKGPAATVLVEEADRAEAVVVGSRGLGGFRRLLLGSVAQHLAHLASSPVVIVRDHGSDAPEDDPAEGQDRDVRP